MLPLHSTLQARVCVCVCVTGRWLSSPLSPSLCIGSARAHQRRIGGKRTERVPSVLRLFIQ